MASGNMFLEGSLPRVFLRTALPIILIMSVSGLFVVVDAGFIGLYAGAAALSAVTLIFPVSMLMVALQSLVSSGMASLIARKLGAGDHRGASETFTSAHGLAALVSAGLAAGYWLAGPALIAEAADGADDIAGHARTFLSIMATASPIAFALGLQLDTMRCEGRLGVMSLVTIGSSVLNIGLNWLFMAVFGLGVAGSALGTVTAQAVCLVLVSLHRRLRGGPVGLAPVPIRRDWGAILALGAPSSLGFIGISLNSAAIITNINLWSGSQHAVTVAAYGIVTRILTFAYLPMMGVSAALQTIAGNNFGAGLNRRVGQVLVIALVTVLAYCTLVEVVILSFSTRLGHLFVEDAAVVAETARILPPMVAVYFLVGQVVMLSGYFQALGDARHAALFGLARPYLFSIPLAFLMPLLLGEPGIWLVPMTADLGMLAVAAVALSARARRTGWRYGAIPA